MDSDSDLLRHFADTGDEAAFTTLVSRHAGMVRGVAWRRTQDWATAEEIAQNVFAILARKAGALRHHSLAGWLHHTAVLEARNAWRKAGRYRDALQHYSHHMTPAPTSADDAWEQLRPHLDEAMARLPEEARHLVVMRYLERRSIHEIAGATGKTAEACRKRLQRSIRLLEALLQRRGLACRTGPALGSLLAAQSLCAPPASAAALAAAALKAAPGLTAFSLTAHALHLMKATTVAKTAALALVLAAMPVTILWQRNAELRAAAQRPRAAAQPAPTPPPPVRPVLPPAAPVPPAPGPATTPAATDPAAARMEAVVKKAKEKAKRIADQEFTRISLNLPDLTDSQKERIRHALEQKGLADTQEMLAAFQSGAVARGVQAPESLTPADQAALARIAALDPRQPSAPSVEDELQAILTPEQLDQHVRAREAKRLGEAEEAANDTLKFIGRSFDLTAEQKDRLFQQLAQHELSPAPPSPPDRADPFPQIGSKQEARDRIIRANLTPPQAEVFDRHRAAEREVLRQQMMEFYAKPRTEDPIQPNKDVP